MNVEQLIASMTPDIYKNMREAVELGRWGDGRSMQPEQKEICVEALIRYEHMNNVPETERVGYVDTTNHKKKKAERELAARNEEQPLKIIK